MYSHTKLHIGLFLIFILLACSTQNKKEESKETIKYKGNSVVINPSISSLHSTQQPQVKLTEKIILDSLLADESNEYLAEFENGILLLSSYRFFDITGSINYNSFNDSIEIYKPFESEGSEEIIHVYRLGSSIVKTHTYNFQGQNRIAIIYGRIYSNHLLNNTEVKIGMQKQQFLELFFEKSEFFDKIQNMIIYEDAMGEAYTEYRFRNHILEGIYFESDNEWVKRE